jgi:hypothetical protein
MNYMVIRVWDFLYELIVLFMKMGRESFAGC